MTWIQFDLELRDHWKIDRLAALLKVPYTQALGIMGCLWTWAAKHARYGNVTGFTSAEIAKAARWDGDHDSFIKCLTDASLLDKDKKIHDWNDHGIRYLNSLRKRVEKHRKKKHNGNIMSDVTVTLQKRISNVTETFNQTLPNHKEKEINKEKDFSISSASPPKAEQPKPPAIPAKPKAPKIPVNPGLVQQKAWFTEIWEKYPDKDGRKDAERHFIASVKTPGDWAKINAALSNYLNSERVRSGFIKKGSTWFNNWQDWIDYVDPRERGKKESETKKQAERIAQEKTRRAEEEKQRKEVAENDQILARIKIMPDNVRQDLEARAKQIYPDNGKMGGKILHELALVQAYREAVAQSPKNGSGP